MVMQALIRKARHVLDDPVLRRWLVRRIVGLEKSPPGFVAGQPPYLGAAAPDAPVPEIRVEDFTIGVFEKPAFPGKISLPGKTVELDPEIPSALFSQSYDDLETMLAAHRFAWVPVAGESVDPDWVAAIWQCWVGEFGDARSGWPWHAYTAAERAINIIDFFRRFGLPGDPDETRQLLARHADTIRENLEYFGDHYTSNHLSNNGRGLLRIGTAIGRTDHAETGAKIMVAEAGRIFGRSGILREGSTHYHLLITRNYIDAWIDAQAAGLSQAGLLREIAERAVAAISGLCLPGGLPLIGDVSPDVSPTFLGRLIGDGKPGVWPVNLSDDRQRDIDAFLSDIASVSPDRLADDGWQRFGAYQWQGLAFVSPDGWPPTPGHGHHDLGSFELHDGGSRILVDPGRGSYADSDYAEAIVHNGLMIDGCGPTPINRPYYDPVFRARIVGAPPEMRRSRDGRVLRNAGFGHLKSVRSVEREWKFSETDVQVIDRVDGRGRHHIARRFCIPHPVRADGADVIFDTDGRTYRLSPGAKFGDQPITCWKAYGEASHGTLIVCEQRQDLPFEAITTIQRI